MQTQDSQIIVILILEKLIASSVSLNDVVRDINDVSAGYQGLCMELAGDLNQNSTGDDSFANSPVMLVIKMNGSEAPEQVKKVGEFNLEPALSPVALG